MLNRSATKSQLGHLTLKSSVYAPTAMSHMGQDMVMNHMQSHYRRIVSAKASVDTSAPKSMKKHIKVRDQKKRSLLNRRDMGPLSARSNMSNTPLQHKANTISRSSSVASIPREESSPRGEEKLRSSTPLESSRRPHSARGRDQRFDSPQITGYDYGRLDRGRVKDLPHGGGLRKHHGPYKHQRSLKLTDSDHGWNERELRLPIESFTNDGEEGRSHVMQSNKFDWTAPQGLPHRSPQKTSESTFNSKDFSLDLQQSDDEHETVTTRNTMSVFRHSHLHEGASPGPEDLTFSYKAPPSVRKEPNTINIWEEEQLYLKFISDVTTDILARGVFSNRVLQQVFDSHVEKRKDQLDEERMRDMIDQLKEDLNITD